jgi:DNA-binding Xre family transcriptional regulator
VPKGVSETLECLENLSHSRGVFSMARIMMSTPQRSTVEQIFNLYICSVTSEGVKDKTLATYKQHFSPNTINNLKHNKSITIYTLEKLCTILECTPNDVIEFTED